MTERWVDRVSAGNGHVEVVRHLIGPRIESVVVQDHGMIRTTATPAELEEGRRLGVAAWEGISRPLHLDLGVGAWIEGKTGELMAGIALGRHATPTADLDEFIEVRTTKPNLNLPIYDGMDDHKLERPFLLVWRDGPRFTLVGWEYGYVAARGALIKPYADRPAFHIWPWEHLHSPEGLRA